MKEETQDSFVNCYSALHAIFQAHSKEPHGFSLFPESEQPTHETWIFVADIGGTKEVAGIPYAFGTVHTAANMPFVLVSIWYPFHLTGLVGLSEAGEVI